MASVSILGREHFHERVAGALGAGKDAGVLVFLLPRFASVRASHGESVASGIRARLAEALAGAVRPGDSVGLLDEDALAALIHGTEQEIGEASARLHRRLSEASRQPVTVGAAHRTAQGGDATELCRAARERAAASDSGRLAALDDTSLEARYQRLVLLNRMSQELFSDKPFREALSSAANVVLALTGADFVSIYFCDELGRPFPAYRHGHQAFGGTTSLEEERLIMEAALGAQEAKARVGSRSWAAASLRAAGRAGGPPEGVFLVGFSRRQEPSAESERALQEIARLLRDARLIQRNLQQRKTMAAVTEQSADAILHTGEDGRVLSLNPSAGALFQWSPEELVGREARLLCPEECLEESRRFEEDARRDGVPRRFESVRRRKDGGLVPVEGTYSVLRDEDGTSFGMVRVYRDITRRKEIERMKSEFVSLVSHELRTPLTAIQGFAETIRDADQELTHEQRKEYSRIIFAESKRLGELVTDFLDISRLESGAAPFEPETVYLDALAARLAALFSGHPSRASLKPDFAPDAASVRADAEQAYRVLLNLCGNALKYTPPGGEVRLSSRRVGDAVELTVRDQGPGIKPEDQGRIFHKFSRLSDPVSRKTPGTGLGLAICRSIVEAHGGRIWVESAPGEGASFKFTLPVA